MFRARALLAVLVSAWIVPSVEGAPRATEVYTDEPPKVIKELIDMLKEGKDSAIKPLSARDDAAPYLRRAVKFAAATNLPLERRLSAALGPIEDRIYERNKKRYAAWAETGRIDLCAEFLVVCEKKDGFALADRTLPLRKRINDDYFRAVVFYPPQWVGKRDVELFWLPTFGKQRDQFEHAAGDDLTIQSSKEIPSLVRADRCTVQVHTRQAWFVAVRSELRQELSSPFMKIDPDNAGEWYRSVVLVNSSAQFTRATESLIVCDGDIELRSGFDKCVLIANGNVWAEKWGGGRLCYFAATGDIKFPNQKESHKSVFHAGGTVALGGKPKPTDHVFEKQAMLPFGVRFLDPEEFGITLTARKDGVQVSEVAKDSPFARYGVEAGDVVTSIDGEKTTSLPDFRRQLRRGLIAESAVLKIRRGDQVLTRIVFLDGIPIPTAPAPREVKP